MCVWQSECPRQEQRRFGAHVQISQGLSSICRLSHLAFGLFRKHSSQQLIYTPVWVILMRDAIKMGQEETQLTTAPFDPRFPNQNQTKHCFTSFLDYKRCIKARGEDYAPCEYFKKVYTSLCPFAWVEKWESQIDEGRFPAKI